MTERKILVTGRNNRVKALDLRLQRFILDIEIPGTQQQHQPPLLNPSRPGTKTAAAPNPRQTGLLRRAIFSPCGNQIYVGTDKGGLAVFNAYTGDLINELSNVSRSADGTPPTTLSYHPFDYYLAFSGVGQLQPILVYTADDNDTPDDPPLTGGNSSNAISSATAVLTQMKFQMPPPLSFNALASPVHSVAGISPLRSSAPTQYTPYPTAMSDTPGATGRRRQRIVATAVASETMRSLGGSVVAVESKEMNI
jgi:WD40 repeat protein